MKKTKKKRNPKLCHIAQAGINTKNIVKTGTLRKHLNVSNIVKTSTATKNSPDKKKKKKNDGRIT